MAKTKKRIDLKARQVALCEEVFNTKYKMFIAEKIVENCAISYKRLQDFFVIDDQTGKIVKDTWRKEIGYTPELEEIAIMQSCVFFSRLPLDPIYKTPGFLRLLASRIAEYLSSFVMKKNPGANNRNDCTRELIEKLYFHHTYVQNQAQRTTRENQRKYGLYQKAKREAKERKLKEAEKKTYKPAVVNVSDVKLGTLEYSRHVRAKLTRIRTYIDSLNTL